MLLSTSNSNSRKWGKSWAFALIIAALLLGTMEFFWRINGHQPAVVDDQRLWAMERNKIGKSTNEIVLLGSSRMQTDTSTATLHRLAPDYSIINLSADGTCANAVLRDLAADSNFKGRVIVETTSECLMFGDEPDVSQQFYVDYFHKTYNFNVALNRHIATFFQKHLTIVDPYLNLIKVMGDLFVKKQWRAPNYLTTYEDRTRSADYTKLDIVHHKAKRLDKIDTRYRQLAPKITTKTLTERLSGWNEAVKVIHNRGGKVIFVRFPVSDEHWIIDEQYFPRVIYWDPLIPRTSASMVHFKDIERVNTMKCPDTSHLDVRDTVTFTEQLFHLISK